ncbi:MAG: hypothetical protein SNG10_04130 [Rikenellaceae bacterium]
MKKNFFAILALAFAVAIAPSCSDDDSTGGDNTKVSTFTETDSEYTILGVDDTEVVKIEGTIYNETITLKSDVDYLITAPVIVGEGGTLEIEAGSTIYAMPQFASYVLVLQDGKIEAEGSASAPITFCSATTGSKWGGLILNGYAEISGTNESGNVGSTEIASQYKYGGSNDADNSGTLSYIILSDTGANDGASVEHNGLTLNGVGYNTTINNIYVDATLDDGVEFFGGCVNVTNLLVVDPDDDMFDFTQGYRGTLTNAYGVWTAHHQSGEEDPRGVEADGNLDGKTPSDKGQSDFKIVNMTIENNRTAASTTSDDCLNDVIKLRRGAKAVMTNVLVKGSASAQLTGAATLAGVKDLVDLADGKGGAEPGSQISITNSLANLSSVVNIVCGVSGVDGTTYSEDDYTITVNPATANTGCLSSVFGTWTGYQF